MRPAHTLPLVAMAALLAAQAPVPERVGPTPEGDFLLSSGWRLKPAGMQVPLDTFPMSLALSPNGKYLLALNAGFNPPSISVLEPVSGKEVGRVAVPDAWLGLAFAPKGDHVYAGGGSQASVFEFSFSQGRLKPSRVFPVIPEEERTHRDFIGDVAVSPDGRLVYAADLFRDSIVVINPQTGMVIERFPTGRRPYRILFHPDGKSFFVSSWADGLVIQHDALSGKVLLKTRVAPHPTDMVWRDGWPDSEGGSVRYVARLFVAAANTNNVYALGMTEARDLRVVEPIGVGFSPLQPAGMTPSALDISADGSRLYVACSDANVLAVVDITSPRSRLLGLIPTGLYPTAVRALPDGRVVVLNGKGTGSRPNPKGPDPTTAPSEPGAAPGDAAKTEYVAGLQTGSASIIEPFQDEELDLYTRAAIENTPYRDHLLHHVSTGPGNPIPSGPDHKSPIEHVVYILKENRTYDQVFGGVKGGAGDASLVVFGEHVTPNHHKLAREFVLFDNFYTSGSVSADGQNWATAAIAPAFVQRLWPNSYAGRRRHYDYEGGDPAAAPPAGYLWSNVASAGLTLRNYGHFVVNLPNARPDGVQVQVVRDSVLARYTSLHYRGPDLDYPDVERARVFLRELEEFEKTGSMPRLIQMRLGNDHTAGNTPERISPRSMVADNDYALGMIVEGISRSRFWPRTAIFVIEDDAQGGSDHVDAHRSLALVISPYVRRGGVDSTMYNTTSVLRTIGLILGLRPMTLFDASAQPMSAAFVSAPDARPYTAEKPRISLEERNPQ